MSREKDLAKNIGIISIGTICTKLVSFFLLPLYTGILSTDEYGIVSIFNTAMSLVMPLLTLQIENCLFRFLIDVRDSKEEKAKLISSSFFFILIQSIIYFAIFALIFPFINSNYKIFLIINIIANSILALFLQICRGIGDNKTYSLTGFITASITILLNVLFLTVFKMNVSGMLLATLIGYISGIIYIFIKIKLYSFIDFKKVDKKILKSILQYSVPMVPNNLSWWIFDSSDRFIVLYILGLGFTGLLDIAYKFSSAFALVFNIFNTGWIESVSVHIKEKDFPDYFNKVYNILFFLFVSLALVLIAIMPFAFKILINEKFSSAYGLIPIAIISQIFSVQVGLISTIYIAKKETKVLARTSFISALINVVVHLSLIKFIGLYAAVVSTLVSFMFFAIYRTIDINKKYIKIKHNKLKIIFSSIVLVIILLSYYYNNYYSNIISIILAIFYACIINKKSINFIFSLVRKKLKGSEKI